MLGADRTAKVEHDLTRIPSQLRAAQARLLLANKEVQSRSQVADAVSKLALARSEAEAESAEAAIAELQAQQAALKKEQAAQSRRVEVLRRQLELKVEETRAVADAKAAVELADSRLVSANVATHVLADLRADVIEVEALPATIRSPAPALGEHSRERLREAGYSDSEIAAMQDAGQLRCLAAVDADADADADAASVGR